MQEIAYLKLNIVIKPHICRMQHGFQMEMPIHKHISEDVVEMGVGTNEMSESKRVVTDIPGYFLFLILRIGAAIYHHSFVGLV